MDALSLGLAACLAALPTPNDRSALYFVASAGRAIPSVLGSEDPRWFHTLGIAWERPERRLRYKNNRANLVLEGYYERSGSPGVYENLPNRTDAWGLLVYARYRKGRMFFDIGWGAQYTDMKTVDISSKISSTPNVGVGFDIGSGALLGVRIVHISNAGLSGNNQGTHRLAFFGALKF